VKSVFTLEADLQVMVIDAWWTENRPAARELFRCELRDVCELLEQMPFIGRAYGTRGGETVRRVLLPRSRYHVFYEVDADAARITVRAVWSARRGQGPNL
jgi:plasmid stabilization system protein ParE